MGGGARSAAGARRSTRGWVTSWRASDASCRGSASRMTTASIPTTAPARSRSSSMAEVSSSSTTSCVRPELRGRLPDQLIDRGQHQRRSPSPECARRDHAPRVAGSVAEVAVVQTAHGLGHPMGVVSRQRVQLRPRLLDHRRPGAHVGRPEPRVPAADRREQWPTRAAPMSRDI